MRCRGGHRGLLEAHLACGSSARRGPHHVQGRRRPERAAMTPLLETLDSPAPLPRVGRELIDAIERAHIVGRGGASFPAATKWRAVAERSHGNAVIVVNGAEGEPQSKKDRALMTARPHLILDGAFLAARALRANRIVLYIGERHDAARNAMVQALRQRAEPERSRVEFAAAPA